HGLGVVMSTTLTEPLTPSPASGDLVAERAAARRRVGFGIATVLLGLIAVAAFGIGSESGLDAVFVLSRRSDAVRIPDVTVPARPTGVVLGVVVAVLGALLVAGVLRRRTFLVFGVGLALFVVALLAWAARGDDRSEEHTSELQSRENLVCRLLLEKKKGNRFQ